MATYLLTWNPERWQWTEIQDAIAEIAENGFCNDRWSSGVTKRIQPDDRVFLMKLGSKPRGIVASGWVTSEVFEAEHWDEESPLKTANYVDVRFESILDPENDNIFPIELLDSNVYRNVNWTPQASGMRIPDEVAERLEEDWAHFLNRPVFVRQVNYADEIDVEKTYQEGSVKQVIVNVHERRPIARAACINKYGTSCFVCGFNFGEKYGELGEGFIHVHHLKPLSEIGENYELNPINDLRPVCPNCHAMLHQRKPIYSIEELKEIIKRATQ